MLKRSFLATAVVISIGTLFAACSSSAPTASSPTTAAMGAPALSSATDMISDTTRMICSEEAEEDIAISVGVKPTKPLRPAWRNHEYSCVYKYPSGSMRLSVKQLADTKSTVRYFNGLVTSLGRRDALDGVGEGAFTTKKDSVVVRKDNKVLIVDVAGLPPRFGLPADVRANVAVSVAATIMGCWTGE
jgi:hypothetical protein